jgi:arylsulfatase A-like enzyme
MIASPRHPECDLSDLCPENCISPPSDRPRAEIMRPAGFETAAAAVWVFILHQGLTPPGPEKHNHGWLAMAGHAGRSRDDDIDSPPTALARNRTEWKGPSGLRAAARAGARSPEIEHRDEERRRNPQWRLVALALMKNKSSNRGLPIDMNTLF